VEERGELLFCLFLVYHAWGADCLAAHLAALASQLGATLAGRAQSRPDAGGTSDLHEDAASTVQLAVRAWHK
jgi:hypothetical protein